MCYLAIELARLVWVVAVKISPICDATVNSNGFFFLLQFLHFFFLKGHCTYMPRIYTGIPMNLVLPKKRNNFRFTKYTDKIGRTRTIVLKFGWLLGHKGRWKVRWSCDFSRRRRKEFIHDESNIFIQWGGVTYIDLEDLGHVTFFESEMWISLHKNTHGGTD